MGSAAAVVGRRTGTITAGRRAGQRLTILSVLALVLGALAALGAATPAQAAQAPGHDVPIYANGWAWTYATTFTYNDGASTNATINENVTYTNQGPVTFMGQDAYRLNITGNITGGSGSTDVDGVGRVNLSNFSGSVSGVRYVRRSDLALLQESQQQHLNGDAKYSIFTIDVTADIDLTLTPSPAWRTHDFPLNGGDSYHEDTDVNYSGGFNYSSSVASGNGPFNGTLNFDAPATVTTGSVNVPINSSLATDNIFATSSDGTVDNHWWSPAHKADGRHFMRIPMDDGAVATIDRRLSAASTPTPGTTMTETITPSLSCAGGPVTVAGKVGNTAGVPVSIAIDKSPINPGQKVTTNTTTTANGNYSVVITAPSENDGMSKNGSRANWGVLVSGGGANNVATLVVTPQGCSTIDYTGATAAPYGTNATVSAKLTDLSGASPSGRTVTFSLSGGGSVNGITNGSGIATASMPILGPPRTAAITASYAGSSALAAASETVDFEVGKIGTSTSVLASPSTATIGDPVTFTSTVTPTHGSTPTGSVQFKVDGDNFGAAVPLTGDTATSAPISTLGLGDHTVTATYNGDGNYSGSTSPVVTFKVRNPLLATTTTSAVSPTASVSGEQVTLSSTVTGTSGTPTGTVTFTRGATTLGTATLDGAGNASLDTTTLPVGSYGIVATYGGDDTYNSSAATPKTVTVAKADVDVDLTSSDTTTVSGESVGFGVIVATVAPGGGTPEGTVQLQIDGADVGGPVELTGGAATFPAVDSLLAGNHAVSVSYSGSATHENGSDSLTQVVGQADTTTIVNASPSPSNEGQNVTITALVSADAPGSGDPTGTVTFRADGDVIGAAPLESTPSGTRATLELADLAPGSYTLRATYAGDTGYGGSESEGVSHTVLEGVPIIGTTTSVTSSQNPSIYGELISFTAEVTADDGSTPAGAVQFSVDGTNVGGPVTLVGGVAESPTLASPDPGDHTVIAAFQPAEGYSSSGWFLTQTVAAAGVDLTLESSEPNSSYGEDLTFTATLASQQTGTGAPTGFVQFRVDGEPLGDAVPVQDGAATSPAAVDLLPGDHTVTALYSGDVRFEPATASYTQAVAKVDTTTTLAESTNSTTYGQPVELTATVTAAQAALGAPDGTVTFKDGTTTLATVAVVPGSGASSSASLTVSDLDAGSHDIRAVYSGSPTFEPSQSNAHTVTVGKQVTSLEADAALVRLIPLGLPLGQLRVTLTSGGNPVAGAPIVFKIGPNTACVSNTNAQGIATCNALPKLVQLTLALGYTASYAGDANHVGSTARAGIIK
jgi:hypothetical protein